VRKRIGILKIFKFYVQYSQRHVTGKVVRPNDNGVSIDIQGFSWSIASDGTISKDVNDSFHGTMSKDRNLIAGTETNASNYKLYIYAIDRPLLQFRHAVAFAS